jgi:tRNA(Ile)-lysidine synthase
VRTLAPGGDVSSERVQAAVRMVLQGNVSARAQFSGGAVLRLDYESVVVEVERVDVRADESMLLLAPGQVVDIASEGITGIPGTGWSLGVGDGVLAGDGVTLFVPPDAPLSLRTREPGDRFAPQGMGGHSRKIKDWMIDHRVPRAIRNRVPLLMVDGEVGAIVLPERWVINEAYSMNKQWLKKRRFFVKYS